jgi:pyridoxine 4-dehydrogenase
MSSINASASGQLRIGDITINRLGYGAMRITGPGVWGAPTDRNAALATLRRLPELGVNFVDTADSYGPNVSEELIREALHPYAGLLVATKAGFTRQGPGRWTPHGDPAYLIAQAKGSLTRLGVRQIDLWQLHRIDPAVPRAPRGWCVAPRAKRRPPSARASATECRSTSPLASGYLLHRSRLP